MPGLWTAVGCFVFQVLLCGGAESGLAVNRWQTKSQLKYTACSVQTTITKPRESVVYLSLKRGDRVLAKVTTRCPTPPCTDERVALATRGFLRKKAAHLLVAWEPSINLDLDDGQHTLSCMSGISEFASTKDPDPVSTIPATKRTWRLKKSPGTEDSALVIEVGDDQEGWKPIVSQSKGSTGPIQFYNSTAESDDMSILKVVDTADVFSLTVLVSQDSTLPADSDKWRCTVKVGGVVKNCSPPSSEEETLSSPGDRADVKAFPPPSSQEETLSSTGDSALSSTYITIVVSLVCVIVFLLIFHILRCFYWQKTKTDPVYCCQKLSCTETLRTPVEQTREDDDSDLQSKMSFL